MSSKQSEITLATHVDDAQAVLQRTISGQLAVISRDLAVQRYEFSAELAVLRAELEFAITNSKFEAIKASESFVFQMFWVYTALAVMAIALVSFLR